MPFKLNPLTGLFDYYEAGSGGGAWGSISGTLSDQTDLQTALDGKVDENAPITGATKTKITYDAKGLVTAGADATQDDIGDGTTYKQYSDTEKTKLAGIEAGAEVNNISDANATDLTDGGATTLHTHAGGGGDTAYDQANYIYSSTTTASDPGATYFRLNYNTVETVNNKVLTGNVATLTTVATHGYAVGQYVYVSIGDAVFDGLQRITAVNAGAKTFSFAKTNASIASTSASGTAFNVTKITDLYIDTLGVSSTDYTEWLKQLNAGDTLVLANTTDTTKWLRFKVAQTLTNNTGWYTIKVAWTGGTIPPANNDAITFIGEHNHAGQVHFWTTTTVSSNETPPSTLGADGDICFIKPNPNQNNFKNHGWRISEKVNGAWLATATANTNTHWIPYIPVMGPSTVPAPVTGQAVAAPQAIGATTYWPADWNGNNSGATPLASGTRYYSLQPGTKASVGKGLGSYGVENMAFFASSASVGGLPMDIDAIKMKFSTSTAATDPGTEYIKVNNGTASSVTQVYCSELGYTYTVSNKALTSGVATLTTSAAHNYFVGQKVTVAGVDATFNGTYTLTAVPTTTTFSFAKNYTVTNKALTANVATLTIGTHPFIIGSSITVSSVDSTFNGTYTVTAIAATTVSYAKVASDVPSTSATGMVAFPDVASAGAAGTANADLTQQMTRSTVATPPAYAEQAPYAIRITQDSDATRYIHVWKNAANTDNGTWRTIPTTFAQVGAGGLPANLADVTVRFYYNNAYWIANGYAESQYGIGVCVRGDGNVSLRGIADRGVYDSIGGTAYITNTVLTANVVTITTSQAHGFAVGNRVIITNATNATYNGTYTIATVPTSTTFTYALVNANIASAVSIGEACNGAAIGDYILVEKYVNGFTAFLVSSNAVVYELPRSSVAKFKLVQLLAYDDLLGTQGLIVTTQSRDHNVIGPVFTY